MPDGIFGYGNSIEPKVVGHIGRHFLKPFVEFTGPGLCVSVVVIKNW